MEDKIRLRIEKYCAYQERSHQQVRDKLYEWGLHKSDVESGISDLINKGYLNEQRFANTFSRGKLNIKHWGKSKIKYSLKIQHKVSDRLIDDALRQIDESQYKEILRKVLIKYFRQSKEKDFKKRMYKTVQYAISRGYESQLVWNEIQAMRELSGFDNT